MEDILHHFYHNKHEIEVIVEDINREDGEGVCFLMDGLDECRHPNLEHSVVLKLLEKTYLPQSMVVVFTRPSASKLVNAYLVSKRIEVFGFSKKNVWEYIDQFPFEESLNDESCLIAGQLKDFLCCHANIHDMCYLPIHVAMICFLFQFSRNIPSSQTQVYEEFTRLIVHRHLKARGKYCEALLSLKDLDREYGENFKDVCHLAYDMTVTSNLVVSSLDEPSGSGKLSEETGLGLLTIGSTLYPTGIHENYSFLHLTFQEFLTAYYLANYLDENQQLDAMQQFSNLTTVWIFFSGLINFETGPERFYKLLEIMPALPSCLSAFESQQEGFCDEISRRNFGKLVFFSPLTVTALVAIAYVMTTSSVPVTRLFIQCHYDYDDDRYDDDRLGILFRHLGKAQSLRLNFLHVDPQILDDGTKHLIKVLRLSDSMASLDVNVRHALTSSARELADQINSCNHLKHLHISYSGAPDCIRTFVACMRPSGWSLALSFQNLDVGQIKALGEGIKYLHVSNLVLKMLNCDFDENCMVCLVDGIRNIDSLHLNLFGRKFSSSCIMSLAGRLHAVPIHGLNLSHSRTVPDSASALANGVTATTGLVELNLVECSIGPDGAAALACSLKFMTKLRSLKLSYNCIGPDGATALAAGLKHVSEMKTLVLSQNDIGPDGATALAAGLKHVSEMKTLVLSQNDIGPDGATALAAGLKHVSEMEILVLSQNDIGPRGAIALAGVLQDLTKLITFNLSRNNVNLAGAMAVLCSLKKCQHLKTLYICGGLPFQLSSCDIVIEDLVSPDDKAAMADLVQAAQHEREKRTLYLGFITIKVPPKNISL